MDKETIKKLREKDQEFLKGLRASVSKIFETTVTKPEGSAAANAGRRGNPSPLARKM